MALDAPTEPAMTAIHDLLHQTLPDLHEEGLAGRLQHLIDHKTKPLGALGRLESLALRIGLVLGTARPELLQPQMVVFAADHGLALRGVSAFPPDVTWQMVHNFLQGGAAVSVLARQHGLALTVVDAGVRHAFEPTPGLDIRKVRAGTRDASVGPAMSAEECAQALAHGADVVARLPGNAVLLGEMGIGNTSSAALLMSRFTGLPLSQCIGRGTGLDDEGLARKQAVLMQALACHAHRDDPFDLLAALGGLEIAMMAGAALQAARERRVVVVDGFIASSAVLVASRWQPRLLQRCVFAHQSDESGHARMLAHLGADPLLQLGLRLGEGSGAALAWPLLESACRLLREMASFESAGVSGREA